MNKMNANVQGISFPVLAMFILSLQDIAIKWIGGDFPVLEIVVFRNLVALPCTLILFRLEGQGGLPTTQRHKLEYVRGFLLFLSFTTYMMGLAALPLAGGNGRRQPQMCWLKLGFPDAETYKEACNFAGKGLAPSCIHYFDLSLILIDFCAKCIHLIYSSRNVLYFLYTFQLRSLR